MPTEMKGGSEGRCPSCGRQPLERRTIREEFDYGAEDERVRVVAEAVPVLACPACEEVFYGPEAEQAHHRAICKALGLLTPEEIKAVRERLGMNQGEFARLTGIGVASLVTAVYPVMCDQTPRPRGSKRSPTPTRAAARRPGHPVRRW